MNQCVPSWNTTDDHTPSARFPLRSHSNSTTAHDVPMLDYEVAELTWENGQLAMHGLGPPRVPSKPLTSQTQIPSSKYTSSSAAWDKSRAGSTGTLESIVNLATGHILTPITAKPPLHNINTTTRGAHDELDPWFDHHRAVPAANTPSVSKTMTMDALVPNSTHRPGNQDSITNTSSLVIDLVPGGLGSSTRVGSCSAHPVTTDTLSREEEEDAMVRSEKRGRFSRVPITMGPEWSNRSEPSASTASATFGRDSQQVTFDTCDRNLGACFTSSFGNSLDNTSSGMPCSKADDHDSVCHSRPQRERGDEEEKMKKGINGKSSVSTKRGRAAAIHNQSERKRRDKINQRMKTLQKLVPNSSKTDKASMLDEVIEYLKHLQAQIHMMSRMNIPAAMNMNMNMMVPMSMQQQLQMSMMNPIGMGMSMGIGMGMGMDMNTIGRTNIPGLSPMFHPAAVGAFMPQTLWEGHSERIQAAAPAPTVMTDPLSAYHLMHPQPMTMDAYSRMVAMYHQLQQQHPASISKS